jgi:hypothetical protein
MNASVDVHIDGGHFKHSLPPPVPLAYSSGIKEVKKDTYAAYSDAFNCNFYTWNSM